MILNIFSCVSFICMSSLEKFLFISSAQFWFICFPCIEFEKFFVDLEYQSFICSVICKYLLGYLWLLSVGCLLVFLTVSLAVQKLFILMTSHKFIFSFVSLAFGDVPWKKLLKHGDFNNVYSSNLWAWNVLPCLCVFLHFESIFVCGVRKWSSFILLRVVVQFSQHYLLKRLSFSHWAFFPALSKISWP